MTRFDFAEEHPDAGTPSVPGALRAAAVASLGAGAVHATAAGAHSEHRQAAVAFAVVAALQIGWGALALARAGRPISLLGVAVNGAALGGWALAKTSGIGFVEGLEASESLQFADALAAGLAAVAVLGALVAAAGQADWAAHPRPALVGVAAVATLGLAVPGMVTTGSHSHAGGHDDEATHAHGAGDDHGGGDDHGDDHGEHADHGDDHGEHADHGDDHGEHAAVQPPVPYDATLPVDLGGVPGVTPEQQEEAEALVTDTIRKLPQFADWTTLEQRGWYSIGDGVTGFEHYINWPLIEDGRMFDPDHPESLVFEVDGDDKELVAAMYMTSRRVSLDAVPEFGGDLVQWHIHDDLCYAGEENRWRIAGLAPPPQQCPAGTFKHEPPAPMIHVWITPHECGPFASLEGVGAGQVAAGEERACDHAHGAGT